MKTHETYSIPQELLQKFRSPEFPGSFLLSFEGIEGSGKSTQLARLKNALEHLNYRAIVLREPGSTSFGEKLREAILQSKDDLNPLTEVLLFASSRSQLLTDVTLKELNVPNTVVIYDRYIDSSLAYQGYARKLGIKEVLEIHGLFPLTLVPHLTLYLRISAETSQKRQKIRNAPKDYFESKGMEFYQRLVEGYDLAETLFPQRIIKLDGEKNEDQVAFDVMNHVTKLLTQKQTLSNGNHPHFDS